MAVRVVSGGLKGWTEELQSKGKLAFSLRQAHEAFPELSEDAIKLALNRLSKKDKIVSIHKGYYLIIPPQYSSKGILPLALYIDGLMRFLQRPYYVGLLSAAAYHGAAHQQPQEFFVVTSLPALRATERKGIKVNYISKNSINEALIESRKTESGYLKISSPALTATDLVQFEKNWWAEQGSDCNQRTGRNDQTRNVQRHFIQRSINILYSTARIYTSI